MSYLTKASLGVAAIVALSLPAQSAAQGGGMMVDATKAQAGKKAFVKFGCQGCHRIGGKTSGPDLAGVIDRRGVEWLTRWLKNTTEMLQSDSTAMALLKEWKGYKMPQMKVSDGDIDHLLHYIAQETAKLRMGT
jgi:cytochrome c551/c552